MSLHVWCRSCKKITEHLRRFVKGKPRLECQHCGKERDERTNTKQRNVFGAKGRGF